MNWIKRLWHSTNLLNVEYIKGCVISSALPALMGPIMSLKLSKGAFDLCFKNQWQMLFMFMKVFSVCEVKLKSEGNKNPTTGVNKDNLIPRVNDVLPPFICVPKQMKTIENLFFSPVYRVTEKGGGTIRKKQDRKLILKDMKILVERFWWNVCQILNKKQNIRYRILPKGL